MMITRGFTYSVILLSLLLLTITAVLLNVSKETYASDGLLLSTTTTTPYPQAIFNNVLGILGGLPFEHSVEIDANQIFPNETLKQGVVNKSGSYEFTMPILNYNLLGFNISASDIKVSADAKAEDDQSEKIRIDFPVMLASSVNVSNDVINQKYENVDLSSVYAIYDPSTDKFTFHVPFEIAARYLLS
jgi:hypothetical protein